MDIALLIWTTLLLWIGGRTHKTLRGERTFLTHPYFWFASFWIVQFALSSIRLFDYLYPLSLNVSVKIASFHLAFWAGMIAVLLFSRPKPIFDKSGAELSFKIYKIAAPIFVICLVLVMRHSISGSSISLIERILNPESIAAARDEHIAGTAAGSSAGLLTKIAVALFPFAVPVLSAFGYYVGTKVLSLRNNRYQFSCGLMIFLIMFLGSPLIFGGRMYSFIAFFSFWLPFKLGRDWIRPEPSKFRVPIMTLRQKAVTLVGITAALYISVVFQGLRDSSVGAVDSVTRVLLQASLSEWVSRLDNAPEDLIIFLGYFTSSSKVLEYYIGVNGSVPGLFGGDYNFPTAFAYLAKLGVIQTPMPFSEIRIYLFGPLVNNGFAGNVWATLPRDLMADFGFGGTLIFLFLLGVLSQRAFDIYKSSPGPFIAGYCAILMLISVWSCFHSLVFFGGIDVVLIVFTILFGLPLYRIKLRKPLHQPYRSGRPVD